MIQYKSQHKQFLKIKSSLYVYMKTNLKCTLWFPPVSPTVMAKGTLWFPPVSPTVMAKVILISLQLLVKYTIYIKVMPSPLKYLITSCIIAAIYSSKL